MNTLPDHCWLGGGDTEGGGGGAGGSILLEGGELLPPSPPPHAVKLSKSATARAVGARKKRDGALKDGGSGG